MQPALQMASKVLHSQPPFWRALFELCNRRPVEHRLVPETLQEGTSLTSMWIDELGEDQMYPEAAALRRQNFNAAGVTGYVLQKLLILGFETSTSNPGRSGVTVILRRPADVQRRHLISVRIAVEMVWPLLVSEYSAAEKTAASMHIANTLLHELSVSWVNPHPPRLLLHQLP